MKRVLAIVVAITVSQIFGAKAQTVGVTATEIKIGQTAPLSGPVSAYATLARANAAYFAMINEKGGINGRKINLIIADDAFSPPKTVEQTRRLVEQDEVLLSFNAVGTSPNSAIQKYLNGKKVPQLLISSGSSKWNDPVQHPWTISGLPNSKTEAIIFAKYVMEKHPGAKVGLLYQNDDFGKDYVEGLKAGFGDEWQKYLASLQSYEITDPTIDSQIVSLRAKGVEIVILGSLAKQTAQAIRKIGELAWKPVILMSWASASLPAVLIPAGLENATGVISTSFLKDPTDSRWGQDPDVRAYAEWIKKYYPQGDIGDILNVLSYNQSYLLSQILLEAGNDLSRDNILRIATRLDVTPPMFLPGLRFTVTPTDYDPVRKLQLQKFDGKKWDPIGVPLGR
jgi:branched-chain amino acid transport system substrate-binding protein